MVVLTEPFPSPRVKKVFVTYLLINGTPKLLGMTVVI